MKMSDDRVPGLFLELEVVDEEEERTEEPRYLTLHGRHGKVRRVREAPASRGQGGCNIWPVRCIKGWAMRIAPLLVLLILAVADVGACQERGDSIRVELVSGERIEGRLLGLDSTSVAVRWRLDDHIYPLTEVNRVDVWKRRDPGLEILGCTIGSAFGMWVGNWSIWGEDHKPMTGSVAGDVGVGAAFGFALGLAVTQVWPGRWKRVDLDVRLSEHSLSFRWTP